MREIEAAAAGFRHTMAEMVPVIQAAAASIIEFGSTVERMQSWQRRHGIALDVSEAGEGRDSQAGVEAVRGPHTSAEWVDEIHENEEGVDG